MDKVSNDTVVKESANRAPEDGEKLSKYREIIVYFEKAIAQGRYLEGQRLPSESELVKQFGLSRPTVSRAMREMQLGGLVDRKVGSGSYVRRAPPRQKQLTFGLLIPNLGEMEIFESICGQIAREAQAQGYELLWAKLFSDHKQGAAERVCEPYLAKEVAGVFFAPLELTKEMNTINERIAAILDGAGIPVILLDRDLVPFPSRSKHDLVGIDNYAAGHMLAQHLIDCGCRSVAFVAHPFSAATVQARSAGTLGALLAAGHQPTKHWNQLLDPMDADQVRIMLKSAKPDGIICANDKTAAELMQTLHKLKVQVPKDVNVVGIDDVRYAKLLQPALTTIHQPCQQMGTVALQTMLERISNPTLPPRHVMLPVNLIARQSSTLRD